MKVGKERSPSWVDVVASDGPVTDVLTEASDDSWGSVISIAWLFDFCLAGLTVSPVGKCLRLVVTIGGGDGDETVAAVAKAGDLSM